MTAGKKAPGVRQLVIVLALSQEEAEEFTADQPYIVISITDPGEKPAELKTGPNLKGVLRLQFWDVDRDDFGGFRPIIIGQAVQAAGFVREHPGVGS